MLFLLLVALAALRADAFLISVPQRPQTRLYVKAGEPSIQVLREAVDKLAQQVDELKSVVKGLAPTAAEPQSINGAGAAKPAAAGPPVLVPVGAAEARINAWLAEQGKAPVAAMAPPASAIAPPVVSPSVTAAVVAPVVPVAAPPAAAVPAGEGFAVTLDFEGAQHLMRCAPDKTLLEAALDAGVELPHSCMSGSCLTCPGRLLSGSVDQSDGVLEEDQIQKGLILTCVSYPTSDLHFTTIEESELG